MDEKTINTLEFPRVIEKLLEYASFSASADLARVLKPAPTLKEALERQALTTEARLLLSLKADISVGGSHDIRPLADLASRGGVLTEAELLSVSGTLMASRDLARHFEKFKERAPNLAEIAALFPPPPGIIEAISRCISDRAEVLDNASAKLSSIRSEIKISHDRLLSRLERMIGDAHTVPMLQEPIITQRNGRYVIPLRAEFKGRLKSIVHDQSSSGATLFVEPLAVVELNNRWHELQLQERDEARRILAELSSRVGAEAEAINGIVTALARFDFCLMCAKYAEDLHASEPVLRTISPPRDASHPGATIKLFKARHPLLNPETVVPINVDLDTGIFALVITGPNTGGKTVTLKTVGLMVMMAQSGLHIPAQSGSELSFFDNVFADIGDEQSIEQSLSTFSGHITNIVRILERARTKTLVLLDELGAGTDPQEGSALARAILLHLVEKRVPSLIATHYPELKTLAHATAGVVNASMEFDLKTLRPTYHLTIGIPGRSNALLIAKRLGLPDGILDNARGMIDPNELVSDELLNEIHHQREVARKARSSADRDRSLASNMRQELTRRLEGIEDERRAVLEEARDEAEKELNELRKELEALRRQLRQAHQPQAEIEAAVEKLEVMEQKVERKPRRKSTAPALPAPALRPGARVKLRSMKLEGVITSIDDDSAEVMVGNLRVRVKTADLAAAGETVPGAETIKPSAPQSGSARKSATTPFRPTPGMELDLRGMRAEDALDKLDAYLGEAYASGMPFVRIIHGKGTGRLRQVIREALRNSAYVNTYEEGGEKEGGEGVTIAHFSED
ncbi:MAG TPA: endonuclease MutS2 [Anaerolineaceae bacterium]|nr:endonuclease MutS2 [Anaerolineaceae bacterium]